MHELYLKMMWAYDNEMDEDRKDREKSKDSSVPLFTLETNNNSMDKSPTKPIYTEPSEILFP